MVSALQSSPAPSTSVVRWNVLFLVIQFSMDVEYSLQKRQSFL